MILNKNLCILKLKKNKYNITKKFNKFKFLLKI